MDLLNGTNLVIVLLVFATIVWGIVKLFVIPKRKSFGADEFPYVYVNTDGTIREVSPEEREYLMEDFHPADGGRPYIKFRYESVDGWGRQSGFMGRHRVPRGMKIRSVHPDFDRRSKQGPQDLYGPERAAGDKITVTTKDGYEVVITEPDPSMDRTESFAKMKAYMLREAKRLEKLAEPEDDS